MKRIQAFLGGLFSLAVILFAITSTNVYAVYDPLGPICSTDASGTQVCTNLSEDGKRAIVQGSDSLLVKIAKTIIILTGLISVIMVIIGGFRYVISAGDSSGISGAKNTILYALVGLVVAIFSWAIVAFVLTKLQGN